MTATAMTATVTTATVTPALAARGFEEDDFREVADVIAHALQSEPDLDALRGCVDALAARHPLYRDLERTDRDSERTDRASERTDRDSGGDAR